MSHLVSNLVGYQRLVEDVQAVLDNLIPKELEVRTKDGKWFTMHILPYRTLDNVIEGAVLTFAEAIDAKTIQETLRDSAAVRQLAAVAHDNNDAVLAWDFDGRIVAWNPGAERAYGWSAAKALTMNIRELVAEDRWEESLSAVRRLSQAEVLEPHRARRRTKDGRTVEVWLAASALANEAGQVYAVVTIERSCVELGHG